MLGRVEFVLCLGEAARTTGKAPMKGVQQHGERRGFSGTAVQAGGGQEARLTAKLGV